MRNSHTIMMIGPPEKKVSDCTLCFWVLFGWTRKHKKILKLKTGHGRSLTEKMHLVAVTVVAKVPGGVWGRFFVGDFLYTFQRRDAVFFSGAESWLTLGEGEVHVSLFQLAAGPRAE